MSKDTRDIVCVGASAGGVEALVKLVSSLPHGLSSSIFIVLHVAPSGTSVLPSILQRVGGLPTSHARNGELVEAGHIYIAPPDHHLLLKDGSMQVVRGPRENGHRPAIDPLFRSAAEVYGRRAVGVILSGTLDDGTAGARAIKSAGGLTIVQDPDDALYSGMPLSAIERDEPDMVMTVDEIGHTLRRLASEGVDETNAPSYEANEGMDMEPVTEDLELSPVESLDATGERSAVTCPECGGVLWEVQEGELIRFRCRVGHAYSAESMLTEQSKSVETALWAALRALEERATLYRRLALRLREGNRATSSIHRYEERVDEAERHAVAIRRVLTQGGETVPTSLPVGADDQGGETVPTTLPVGADDQGG